MIQTPFGIFVWKLNVLASSILLTATKELSGQKAKKRLTTSSRNNHLTSKKQR